MATLYKRTSGEIKFCCYGERGLFSYFMFQVLPTRLSDLLKKIEPADQTTDSPFKDVSSVANKTLFSELDFGNQGFGKPDGAVYFEVNNHPHFLLVEVKLNQTYCQSCRMASYNSTIRGQLELKWRAMRQYKAGVDGCTSKVPSIVESDSAVRFYSGIDPMYKRLSDPRQATKKQRRRLRLLNGVAEVFNDYINKCDFENIHYVAITDDKKNPFATHADLLPRCLAIEGIANTEAKNCLQQFGWISACILKKWTV